MPILKLGHPYETLHFTELQKKIGTWLEKKNIVSLGGTFIFPPTSAWQGCQISTEAMSATPPYLNTVRFILKQIYAKHHPKKKTLQQTLCRVHIVSWTCLKRAQLATLSRTYLRKFFFSIFFADASFSLDCCGCCCCCCCCCCCGGGGGVWGGSGDRCSRVHHACMCAVAKLSRSRNGDFSPCPRCCVSLLSRCNTTY